MAGAITCAMTIGAIGADSASRGNANIIAVISMAAANMAAVNTGVDVRAGVITRSPNTAIMTGTATIAVVIGVADATATVDIMGAEMDRVVVNKVATARIRPFLPCQHNLGLNLVAAGVAKCGRAKMAA